MQVFIKTKNSRCHCVTCESASNVKKFCIEKGSPRLSILDCLRRI